MPFVNSKVASFTLDSVDLTDFTDSISFNPTSDALEVTALGLSSKAYVKGIKDAKISISGSYDDGATGPGATLRPLIGADAVAFIYDPEGTASGKPTLTGDALVTGYVETIAVAAVIKWSADLQVTGDITEGTVSA